MIHPCDRQLDRQSDRQSERQTDGRAIAYSVLSMLYAVARKNINNTVE